MTIILANNQELTPLVALGAKRTVRGASRDSLSFTFAATESMDELNNIFTTENCETITIVEEEVQYVYTGYTVRVELKREPKEVVAATESSEAVYEDRIIVTMAQRTYQETQLIQMKAKLEELQNSSGSANTEIEEKAAAYDILTGGAE